MAYQFFLFKKKWDKLMVKSKNILHDMCRLNEEEKELILFAKPLKTRCCNGYLNKIFRWCHDNNIDCEYIEIVDENEGELVGIHLKFDF